MSRVQLALNVDDLDEAITFYSKLFGTEPAKVKPGYANFAIAEPPLKLVLLPTFSSVHTSANDLPCCSIFLAYDNLFSDKYWWGVLP